MYFTNLCGFCRKPLWPTCDTQRRGWVYPANEQNCRAGHISPVGSNWPFRIMRMSSMPVSVTAADRKDLNSSIGRASRLIAR